MPRKTISQPQGPLIPQPLYDLFWEKLPEYRNEKFPDSLKGKELARDLDVTTQTIYMWFRNSKLPPKHVNKILNLSGSEMKLEDLIPYVIGT